MGFRDRLKKLQRATRKDMIVFDLEDGTEARFYFDEVFPECFLHESERGRRHYFGEDPGPAHPFVEALRRAKPGEIERLIPTQGTLITLWLGEDEIMRGERERPGTPAKWNAEGTVCE